jgi:aromatic ring-opening dioxygenase catalytic subunit (LigB family)
MSEPRQPAIFLPHGGGPCFWIDGPPPFGRQAWESLRRYLAGIVESLPARPKAILVVTAHWEEAQPTVSVASAPGMIFDYNGFPAHTYELKYPAPGAPHVGRRALELIRAAGLPVAEDAERGYDHGVFVPMLIVDPDAHIPVVMVSLQRDLDPAQHIALGQALAPLRDEGVVVVGSGMSYHDLRHFRDGDGRDSQIFDAWLGEAATAPPAERDRALTQWAEAPAGRACHPREEHLLPLMVVAGAARDSVGTREFHDVIGGKTISAFRFG